MASPRDDQYAAAAYSNRLGGAGPSAHGTDASSTLTNSDLRRVTEVDPDIMPVPETPRSPPKALEYGTGDGSSGGNIFRADDSKHGSQRGASGRRQTRDSSGTFLTPMADAVKLIVAKKPLEKKEEITRRRRTKQAEAERMDEAVQSRDRALEQERNRLAVALQKGQMSQAAVRWRSAVAAIVQAGRLDRTIANIEEGAYTDGDKGVSAQPWEEAVAVNPDRRLLQAAIQKKRKHQYKSFPDRMANELFITGERIFDFFTPARMGKHTAVFTPLFVLALNIVFFFMAAQYALYTAYRVRSAPIIELGPCPSQRWCGLNDAPISTNGTTYCVCEDTGPPASNAAWQEMWQYVFPDSTLGSRALVNWITWDDKFRFDFAYLRLWGGRYGPDLVDGESHRWFTSQFLHEDFPHLLANSLLLIAIGYQLEHKYGAWRVFLLWFISMLGGNLLSGLLEDPCVLVVGASGGVFGLMGLYIADMVLNFETVNRPILRALTIIVFLALFIFTVATEDSTSHMSHVGGIVCGLFPGFLFLPNLKSERWEAVLPWMGVIVLALVFGLCPVLIYFVRLDGLSCPVE